MIRVGSFLVALGICSFLLTLVRGLPEDVDAFAPDQGVRRKVLSLLPAEDAIEVKLAHARQASPYQLGLFGNSRALMVDAASLGRSDGFFNYAVTGVSFATNVAMLERLEELGKLPSTALISFDNPLIAHPPYPALDSMALRRWQRYAEDLAWALRQDVAWRTIRVNLAEQISAEWRRVKSVFSFEQLRLAMAYRFPDLVPVVDVVAYRMDGSRPEQLPDQPAIIKLNRRDTPYLMALELDMQRLSALLARNGMRVVIYHSPIHPAFLAEAETPDADAIETRFRTACRRLTLDCRPAPNLGDPARPPYWPDSNHAPAALLGAYLSGVVQELPHKSAGAAS